MSASHEFREAMVLVLVSNDFLRKSQDLNYLSTLKQDNASFVYLQKHIDKHLQNTYPPGAKGLAALAVDHPPPPREHGRFCRLRLQKRPELKGAFLG